MFCPLNIGKQNVTTRDNNGFFDVQSMFFENRFSETYPATISKTIKKPFLLNPLLLNSCFVL